MRKKIRRLRKQNGLTLRELSSACELSHAFLNQAETGAVNPSLSAAKAIAGALTISLGNFLATKLQKRECPVSLQNRRIERPLLWTKGARSNS